MTKPMIAIIAGAACLLATIGVRAEDHSKRKLLAVASDSFTALDRNGDRRLSRSEAGFDRLLSRTFAEIDTDGDGFVSLGEFTAGENVRTAVNNLTKR